MLHLNIYKEKNLTIWSRQTTPFNYIIAPAWASLIVFVFASIGTLFGQGSAKITGVVSDNSTGSTLPGANVFIENLSMGSITDLDGEYTILRVPTGTHTLQVSFIGYETQSITVEIEAGENVTSDVAMDFILLMGGIRR